MPKSPKLPRGPRKGKKRAGGGKAGKKFEGTPITAETKFETQASPTRSTFLQPNIRVAPASYNRTYLSQNVIQGRKRPPAGSISKPVSFGKVSFPGDKKIQIEGHDRR